MTQACSHDYVWPPSEYQGFRDVCSFTYMPNGGREGLVLAAAAAPWETKKKWVKRFLSMNKRQPSFRLASPEVQTEGLWCRFDQKSIYFQGRKWNYHDRWWESGNTGETESTEGWDERKKSAGLSTPSKGKGEVGEEKGTWGEEETALRTDMRNGGINVAVNLGGVWTLQLLLKTAAKYQTLSDEQWLWWRGKENQEDKERDKKRERVMASDQDVMLSLSRIVKII